jgi:hypothetical protein
MKHKSQPITFLNLPADLLAEVTKHLTSDETAKYLHTSTKMRSLANNANLQLIAPQTIEQTSALKENPYFAGLFNKSKVETVADKNIHGPKNSM